MDREAPVSALSTAQLVTFLDKLGISRTGLDSVWEKEVTGGMLCEFCEEDIKDVFTEFKDRFRVRKLLRDITDKLPSRQNPATQTLQRHSDFVKEQNESFPQDRQYGSPISPTVEVASSALLRLSSSDGSFSSSSNGSESMPVKHRSCRLSPETVDLEECEVKKEGTGSFSLKRQRMDSLKSAQEIPAAHTHAYNLLQSTSGQGPSQFSAADTFLPPPLVSAFLTKPEYHPAFSTTRPLMSNYTRCQEEQKKPTFTTPGSEDQALCLKKSPQAIPSSPHPRNDTASPTTQPSSTTPDYLNSLETTHLDFTSIMTMGQLASKYSAHEILSKKGQRSRPNGAQKLGSILIRNAAQQANLWSSPPHLRSITQPQREEFLRSVYQIAPHVREYEHLLWQRLSETLQNRRKYLLDKKLGKRGFSSSSQSTASSSSHHDFPDFSEWQVTSVHNHLNSLGEDSRDDVNILNEVAAAHSYNEARPIKKEPDE